MADRTVSVRLDLRIGPFQRATTEAAKAVRDFTGKSEKDLDRLGAGMQRLGTRATIGLTAPLVLLAKQAIDTAMTAQEAMSRMNVVFGANANAIEQWAEGSARSMGLASHEAVSYASSLAVMFQEMKLGDETAQQMSTDIVQLAADLGSFHDVDPSDMLERIRAGLVGEVEPLRRVGVLLDDLSVRNKAVEMGLADSSSEVDAAAKVQARYALILEQSSAAQGDYARTSEDATNASRTASAAYKDAMAELGDNLLPLVADGALAVADLAEAFSSLPEGVQSVILGFGGLLAISGPMLIGLGAVVRNLKEIQAVGPKAASALRWGGVIGTLGAVYFTLDQIGSSAKDLGGQIEDFVDKLVASMSGMATDELVRTFTEAGASAELFEKIVASNIGTATRLVDALDAAGVETGAYRGVIDEAAAANRQAAEDAKTGAAALGDQGDEATTAADAIERYSDSLAELYDRQFSVQAASDDLRLAFIDLAQSVADAKANGDRFATSLDDTNASGLRNREMLRSLVDQGFALADALRQQGLGEQQIADLMATYRVELVNQVTQLGFNRSAVEGYLGTLGMVQPSVHTTITVDASQAKAEVGQVLSLMERASLFRSAMGLGDKPLVLPPDQVAAIRARELPPVLPSFGNINTVPRAGGERGGKDPAEEAADRAREALERLRRQYEAGQITAEAYRAELERLRAASEPLSAEWEDLGQRIERVNEDMGEGWREVAEAHQDAVDQMVERARRQYEEGNRSAEDFIGSLRLVHDEMVRLHGYWSREAGEVRDEIRSILDDQARAMEDAAEVYERAMKEAEKAVDDAMDHLNGLLDDERDIRRRLADSREEHEQRMAEIGRKFVEEQEEARREALEAERAAFDERRRMLEGWVGIEERASYKVASSIKAISRNVQDQVKAFAEWQDLLAQARARGVSDAVIDMLGLADSPEALLRLRMFASATDAEIATLNAAVVDRAAQVHDQVASEQSDSFSTLAATLEGLAERHHAEVEKLTEEFLDEQRELKDELAAVGDDQGRSFGDAIAEGLQSSIPAIREAAEAAQRAMRGADGGSSGGGSEGGSGSGGFEVVKGRPPGGGYSTDHGTVIIGKKKYVWHDGTARVPGPEGADVPSVVAGGERIFSVPDNKALIAAVSHPSFDYKALAAALGSVAGGGGVRFGDVHLHDGVDVDLLARRLAFGGGL